MTSRAIEKRRLRRNLFHEDVEGVVDVLRARLQLLRRSPANVAGSVSKSSLVVAAKPLGGDKKSVVSTASVPFGLFAPVRGTCQFQGGDVPSSKSEQKRTLVSVSLTHAKGTAAASPASAAVTNPASRADASPASAAGLASDEESEPPEGGRRVCSAWKPRTEPLPPDRAARHSENSAPPQPAVITSVTAAIAPRACSPRKTCASGNLHPLPAPGGAPRRVR